MWNNVSTAHWSNREELWLSVSRCRFVAKTLQAFICAPTERHYKVGVLDKLATGNNGWYKT